MTDNSPYEILALRYATHLRQGRDNFLFPRDAPDLHDADMPLDYFIWVIRNASRTVVVDTGFTQAVADVRGRQMLCPPDRALHSVGVDAQTVTDVIITHLHYDHAGGLSHFPAATFYLQDAEMGFATGRCMCHSKLRAPFEVEDVVTMVRRVYEDRVRFIDGDQELFPGISVHRVPGHTPGLQCVRVVTARGAVVLASDASHYYANMARQNPFPIVVNVAEMMESWRRLEQLADSGDHIVPGHDPDVLIRYPREDTPDVAVALLHRSPA